jgi:hypothetical protein
LSAPVVIFWTKEKARNTVKFMKIYLTFLIALCFGSNIQARLIQNWSYDMLNANATLVVIATPATVSETTERTNLYSTVSVKGVETSFKVLTVLKGDRKTESFVLHHFALGESNQIIIDGPLLISFKPHSYKLYLMFLQKEADGRYVAVSGQSEPVFSMKQLTESAPPEEFGFPPNAKTF